MTTRVFFFLPSTVYQLFQRIVIDDTSEWTNAGCKVRTNLKRKRKKRHASRTIDELNLYTYILYTKHANLSITTRKKERKKETNYKTIKKKKRQFILSKTFRSRSTIFQFARPFSPSSSLFPSLSPTSIFHPSLLRFLRFLDPSQKHCARGLEALHSRSHHAVRGTSKKRKERGRKEGRKRKKKKEEKIKGKRQKSFAAVKYRSALKRIKTQASFRE